MIRPLLFALFWFLPATALAGSWARPLGGVYLRGGAGFFFGQQSFTVSNSRFRSTAAEFYGEFGISHNLEIDTSIRYVDNRLSGRNRGIEDLEAYVKWAPINTSNALSLLAGTRISLYERLSVGLSEVVPQRGLGGYDVLLGIGYGRSFYPLPLWFTGDVTGRYNISARSGGIRIRAEVGGKLIGPLLGAFTVELQPGFGAPYNPDNDPAYTRAAPVPNIFSIGAKVFAQLIRGVGFNADFSWFPGVFNSGQGIRFGISATYLFDPRDRKKK